MTMPVDHDEHEQDAWTIRIPDHAPRADSPEYVHSRARLKKLTTGAPPALYGAGPWQDHHGGGLWVKDKDGWFMVKNLAGMEWSSQFCADPAKVDQLRLNARRLYAAFPDAADELGIRELLDTPITDAAGVAHWTDSICNASVPLPATAHTGVLPKSGGMHHYPAPIVDITFFKRDDFELWLVDPQGEPIAVVPVAPRGSGDGRVAVLYTTPGTKLHEQNIEARKTGAALVLPATHPVATQAFAAQPDPAT